MLSFCGGSQTEISIVGFLEYTAQYNQSIVFKLRWLTLFSHIWMKLLAKFLSPSYALFLCGAVTSPALAVVQAAISQAVWPRFLWSSNNTIFYVDTSFFLFFSPDEIVFILRMLRETLSPFPCQIHRMKMACMSLEIQKDMTMLQIYWLSAVHLCQMFSLKRIKGESWACGRSLLHSMLVR